ncbi:MAG: AMP-binding protein [Acidobacteria bacterium]|nr:AMP-binding protein [Acidobacteriota bacterium]
MSRPSASDTLAGRFVHTAKSRWSQFCMADSTGRELTYGRALVGSLLLARAIAHRAPNQRHVGLLLPSSVGGALANIAASIAGKVPVNLNFTAGREAMDTAVARCGIATILTSRTFLGKAGLQPMDGMVFLEDVLTETSAVAKLLVLVAARILPASLLQSIFLTEPDAEGLATVIFSSGSTGVPKGVMLSHANILANVDSARRAIRLTNADVMLGVLPFFHAFGYTGTLWLPLIIGFGVAYHPNPTDAKTIGEMAERYRATLLISTPTFCGTYTRICKPEQFASLRFAIVGAERLRPGTAAAFKERFGHDLVEGYGCTEMSPVVAVNVPDLDAHDNTADLPRGSVGRALPGIEAKVVDIVSGEGPLVDIEGLLLVRGLNAMAGYLGDAERTRSVFRDGWYVTGDIATIDAAGHIRITDRLSRFSKIAGEMVPHMKVEEQLQSLLPDSASCVVTSVPDSDRGERLVAFYTDPTITPAELWKKLGRTTLPKLWVPKREDLRFVDAIPTLGTGKTDLRAVRDLAAALSEESEPV